MSELNNNNYSRFGNDDINEKTIKYCNNTRI